MLFKRRSLIAYERADRVRCSLVISALLLAACSQLVLPKQRSTASSTDLRHSAVPALKEYVIKNPKLQQSYDVVFDPQGNLWFNAFYPYLGRRSPDGTITALPFPHSNFPYGAFQMTLGPWPNRRIWFTDFYGEQIGGVDSSGHVRLYQPFASFGFGVTTGIVAAQYHLWVVTGGLFSSLDEFTTAPKGVKTIELRGAYCYPVAIITTTDNDLWIANSANCPKISRVTPDGKITDFPINAAQGAEDLTQGPDGNVWFTAASGPRINPFIGKITPEGRITEYPISDQADGITVGPDGNMWYTLPWVGKIDSMTLDGQIVDEITLPGAINESQPRSQAAHIVRGPDGNLWFAEAYRNKIGELIFSQNGRARH